MMIILDHGIHLAHTMSFEELDRCLDLITYNGAKTLNVESQYGIEEGKSANFLVLDADTPFEAVRQRGCARVVFLNRSTSISWLGSGRLNRYSPLRIDVQRDIHECREAGLLRGWR